MALFRWFTTKTAKPASTLPPVSSSLAHSEATQPLRTPSDAPYQEAHGNAANRKTERLERRELLYAIVRDCMTHAGILSASYKFKVLSLDSRGRQYLIMMDLPQDQAGNTTRLAEIEGLIANAAKNSHDIFVTAVYWRVNQHVTAGLTRAEPRAAQAQQASVMLSAPPLFEPLQDDEVAAFKRALASGAPLQAHSAGELMASGPRNPQPMPQFQDTEIDEALLPLGPTQYGDIQPGS